ncbi:MAG TPA: hypothetical protein VGI20_07410 [Rhizomicrobium sp.]|jgi:hypothetical protein
MLTKLGAALVILIGSAGSLAAQEMCGAPPIAPVIPSVADMRAKPPADAGAARHAAFGEIKNWQVSLKSYRDCLNATMNTDKRDLGEAQREEKPDKDKIAKLQQDLTTSSHAWDVSVDDEEKIVNEWNAAGTAYCLRSDVDRASCPKT